MPRFKIYFGSPPDVARQVVRPVSTSAAGNWTAEPSGTLHGVTSDVDDATHAQLLDDDAPSLMTLGVETLQEPLAGDGRLIIRRQRI